MAMPPEMLQAMMAQQGGPPPGGNPQDPSTAPPQAGMGQGQPPMGGPQPQTGGMPVPTADPDGDSDNDQFENYLNAALSEANLAKKLSKSKKGKETLAKMGQEIVKGFSADVESGKEWTKMNKEWLDMALLIRKPKSFPWPKASNTKYPLLATAAMQFSARAYPALVPADGNVVKAKVTAGTPSPDIFDAAKRVAHHMSYQLMECVPNWEEEMDKLLLTMAISGICFKKTYHNSALGVHESKVIYPSNFVVNYNAKSLESAYRKTEILEYIENEYQEKVRNNEEFLKIDLPTPTTVNQQDKKTTFSSDPPPADKSTPHVFLACHTFWDLDDDGYEEPYVIVVHKDTKQVVRIISRWDLDGVKRNEDGEIMYIQPVEYFTAFPFIPNPDGSIYGLGFGMLLSPLNKSVDTIINQLTDAGSISNMQSGFIGKGLRLKMGETPFKPGEWKVVNATGDDLHRSIVPLPAKEPSGILFQLMQFLVTSGNQLASIAEIFVGKMPGQNTPASTTQETVQQGMAVFTAIYKRVYRSLTSEFNKLYRLNKINPDIVAEESKIAGIPLQVSDYELPNYMIIPGADPIGDSVTVKMAKLQQVGQLLQMGTINPQVFTKRMLEANDIPNPEELIAQPQPPAPDPKAQAIQAKSQSDQALAQQKMALGQQSQDHKEKLFELKAALEQMKNDNAKQKSDMELTNKAHSDKMDQVMQAMNAHFAAMKGATEIGIAHHKNAQTIAHQEDTHQQALAQGAQAFNQQQQQKAVATPKGKTKPKE
jgi:chaperonin GroES